MYAVMEASARILPAQAQSQGGAVCEAPTALDS